MIKFIGTKEGGMDKLKGKKIVILYHDSAYGKETDPDPRRAGEEVRLHGHAYRRCRTRATSRVRSGCRSARSSPTG